MNAVAPSGASLPSTKRPSTGPRLKSVGTDATRKLPCPDAAGAAEVSADVSADLAEIRHGWMDGLFAEFIGEVDSWDTSLDDATPDPYDQMFSFAGIFRSLQAWGRDENGEPRHWSL